MRSVAALLVVLLAIASVATMIPAGEADPRPNFLFDPRPIPIPSPFMSDCLKTIDKVEDCLEEVLSALLQGKLKFSPKCCEAIGGLSDSCFEQLFLGPFTKAVGEQVKSFCHQFLAPIGLP